MCEPFRWSVISSIASSAAADFGLRAGAETLGHRDAHLDEPLGA
jgi:hypothetical protein